ncbi:hypothetical protein SLS56_002823 [Neofusicoccum ribis]|uniref:Ankyrin n=1 Tax=Neofusicoccum ribis TaxID=45134 RepID=A0ABR3T286_9PEZI
MRILWACEIRAKPSAEGSPLDPSEWRGVMPGNAGVGMPVALVVREERRALLEEAYMRAEGERGVGLPFYVALAVDAVLWWRYLLTPPLSLSIRNVVPTDIGLFAAVAQGDIDFMVEELENDQGRPTDIGPDGSTLAYVAVAYHQYEALQLLLNIGVDPHWENDFQQSAYDRAWEGVFVQDSPGKAKPNDAMSTSIFHDKTRMLEDCGLTRLHKIVLGLETGDIEAELRSGASINATDRFNRTPLFWASGRGDIDAVRLLLDRGADPNIADTEGSTALRRCHGNQRLDIAQLLVSRGADVHWRNKLGMGGLHSVASYGMPVEWFSLYEACDTEARGGQTNLTPLAIACKYNRPLHASWLLAHGASPHTPLSASDPTSTLLHHTVAADHPACVALLLQHAAATAATADTDSSLPVLLDAAARASTPTLDALAAYAYGAHAAAAVVDPAVARVLAAGAGWLPGEKPALRRVLLTRWAAGWRGGGG